MSIAQIFFRKDNKIDTIEFDAVIIEGATADTELTTNPVEQGAPMTDHIIIKPMEFFVKGVVSNASSNIVGQVFAAVDRFTKAESKAEQTWNDLLNLQASKQVFTYVQGLKSYNNVYLKTISESQDKDTSNGLYFDAILREVNFVGATASSDDKFIDASIFDAATPGTNGGFKQLESTA